MRNVILSETSVGQMPDLRTILEGYHCSLSILSTDGIARLEQELFEHSIFIQELNPMQLKSIWRLAKRQPLGIIALFDNQNAELVISALELGADCISIEIPRDEFTARLKANLQRYLAQKNRALPKTEFQLDQIHLTKKERVIFNQLLNSNKVVTKEELLKSFWDRNTNHDQNIINVYIHRIRQKFSAQGIHDIIVNINRTGYKLDLTKLP